MAAQKSGAGFRSGAVVVSVIRRYARTVRVNLPQRVHATILTVEPVGLVMRMGFVIGAIITFSCTPVLAECSQQQIDLLVGRGMTKMEIDDFCAKGESGTDSESVRRGKQTLHGTWRVSLQSPQRGTSVENWEINTKSDPLRISTTSTHATGGVPLPMDYRRELSILAPRFSGRMLTLTVRRSASELQRYELTIVGTDTFEGHFESEDRFLPNIGAVQGAAGILKSSGKVTAEKISPHVPGD
jgi:hypothetical protein